MESDHEKNLDNSDDEVLPHAVAANSTSYVLINAEKQSADDDDLSEESR